LAALVAVIAAHLLISKDRNWAWEIPNRPVFIRIGAYLGLALLIVCLGKTEGAPFIYFQF
jgi:hypothetical protein